MPSVIFLFEFDKISFGKNGDMMSKYNTVKCSVFSKRGKDFQLKLEASLETYGI